VVAFDLVTEQQALPPQFELACDAAPFDLAAEDGRLYRMLVSGKTAEGTPLGAECFAVGAAGLSVPPTCNPLSASGSLTVSLAGLLGEDDAPVCPAGMSFDLFDESLGLLNDVPLACTGQTHVGPLTPASYVLDAVVYDDAGLPHGPGATCTGSVAAGQSVPAVCF
jgi:hypothetical protein